MNPIHKIAVIGGTGKSGRYLVKQLLEQRIPFRILVRNPERFSVQSPLAEVVEGDVKDYAVVHNLIKDCYAVISTLGLGLPPSEPTIFSLATKHIIRAMDECNVRRYILITGLNVDTPFDKKGFKIKAATDWMYTHYPKSTTDKQAEYAILVNSQVDWTLIRLPFIEQAETRGSIRISLEDCPGDKISATALAHFLIEQLTDETYIGKSPFVATV